MKEDVKVNEAIKISEEILLFSRDHLVLSLRFLQKALYEWTPICVSNGEEKIGTNGVFLFYNYKFILQKYKEERESIARTYLHMIFHFILHHPFIKKNEEEIWHLAADIAVENTILNLNLNSVETTRDHKQKKILTDLKKQTALTTEKIYRYFYNNPLSNQEYKKYCELFHRDYHNFWYLTPQNFTDITYESYEADEEDTKDTWEKISEEVKINLETLSDYDADTVIIQNLKEVHRDRYDYNKFLKSFATLSEEIEVNHDEFDYSFYTYGMELYKNMPLIEPLEYKEANKIKDFVIAIDTSGSVSGELVQKFLEKTYSILRSTENFFRKVNIHIIQSDYKIRSHVKISDLEEFDDYVENMQLIGFGSTDFRPVFLYVEDLIDKHEFDNLKGLIYFTDGYGTFPKFKPKYNTAFVFLENQLEIPRIPIWANKVVLQEEDI